jgi:aspartyl protease family protein
MLKKIMCFWIVMGCVPTVAAMEIQVAMLANGSALLQIDGKQRFLRAGNRSPEGVLLVSANQQAAVIEWDGEQRSLTLNKRISTAFSAPAIAEVRIASGRGGHYITPGRINGLPVSFMVDTGATMIAMNYQEAERLGIDYRAGTPISVNTANGVAKAFKIVLHKVAVGNIELHQVMAAVSTTTSPAIILLGNSYLSKVDMRVDEGVLLLQAKN